MFGILCFVFVVFGIIYVVSFWRKHRFTIGTRETGKIAAGFAFSFVFTILGTAIAASYNHKMIDTYEIIPEYLQEYVETYAVIDAAKNRVYICDSFEKIPVKIVEKQSTETGRNRIVKITSEARFNLWNPGILKSKTEYFLLENEHWKEPGIINGIKR